MRRVRGVVLVLVGAVALVAAACSPPPGDGGGGGTTTTTAPPAGPPIAVAGASPTVGDAPLTVHFSSSGSSPGTGTGLTYSWDFGDGSPAGSGASTSHVYEEPGIYTAKLTMTSSEGSSTSPGITITVNVDPNPKFHVRPGGSTGPDCGPLANPCATISEAQANALANGVKIVRVAGGSYHDPITLASGMEISGGWKQDFSDFGSTEVTTIYGTGTTPPVTINGAVDAKISGVSAQGVARTSGDAVGIVVMGGSRGIEIGDNEAPLTVVGGGSGPNATGVLVTGGSFVDIVNAKINSGTTVGAGSSAYGVRVLGLSVVNVILSEVTAQPGNAGTSGPSTPPAQAASGCGGGKGAKRERPEQPRQRRWRRRVHHPRRWRGWPRRLLLGLGFQR